MLPYERPKGNIRSHEPLEVEGLDGLQPFREGPWHFIAGVRIAGEKIGLELAAGARLNDSGSDWVAQARFHAAAF